MVGPGPLQRAHSKLRALYRLDNQRRRTGDLEGGRTTGDSDGLPPVQEEPESGDTLQQGLLNGSSSAAAPWRRSTNPGEDAGAQGSLRRTNSFKQAVVDLTAARRLSSSFKTVDGNDLLRVLRLGSGTGLIAESVPEGEEAPGVLSWKTDARAIWSLLTSSYMNVLLICVPLGFIAEFMKLGGVWVFLLNFMALVPLALMLGEVTEDLALRFGDTIGGLLNATFGNTVEMILSVAALTKGLNDVVAASLIGSILSNLLLVLGCCFLFGGSRHKQQSFSVMVNKASCSLLFMACIGLTIPVLAKQVYGEAKVTGAVELNIAHATALLLAFVYICYLYFQLGTHRDLFLGEEGEGEVETPALSLVAALGTLTAITVVVAFCSEFLTGALKELSETSGLNELFLGLIVLPIAGNACEHITAVFVAVKDKMDLAIGVALGSSIQIAIFVVPMVVLIGWLTGHPFTLDFDPFAVVILTMSVLHAYFLSADGTSNWLLGVQLVGTYTLIALLYLFLR